MTWKVLFTEALKGGTGKTTVSGLIAYLLAEDKKVILIDADLDSPNTPRLFGLTGGMTLTVEGFTPAKFGDNLYIFSMGLLAKDRAISMTGEGYVQILRDVLNYTDWGFDTDDCYVVVDCPAGASDIFRTLVRYFAKDLIGTILVTIPREGGDLDRVIRLNRHFEVPILGVIENMAAHVCEECSNITHPFGEPTAEEKCQTEDIPFLGAIPLAHSIQVNLDNAKPYLPEGYDKPIVEAIDVIKAAKPAGKKILARLRSRVKSTAVKALGKLFAKAIIRTNTEIDFQAMQDDHGFGDRVTEICVTDENNNALFELYMTVKNGKLLVPKTVKNVDTAIFIPIDILRRLTKHEIDLPEAYYAGDIQIYGDGATPRALLFFETVWGTIEADASKATDFMGDEIEAD